MQVRLWQDWKPKLPIHQLAQLGDDSHKRDFRMGIRLVHSQYEPSDDLNIVESDSDLSAQYDED